MTQQKFVRLDSNEKQKISRGDIIDEKQQLILIITNFYQYQNKDIEKRKRKIFINFFANIFSNTEHFVDI